jgi:hypothetical protein
LKLEHVYFFFIVYENSTGHFLENQTEFRVSITMAHCSGWQFVLRFGFGENVGEEKQTENFNLMLLMVSRDEINM